MTNWMIVLCLLSVSWSIRCHGAVPAPSLERLLQSPSMVDNSESQLVQMIAKALAAKSRKDAKLDTSSHGPAEPDMAEMKEQAVAAFTTTPEDDVTVKVEDQENEIVYLPVKLGQFGDPGNGSKFLEALQNFDITKYSIETDADYSTLAGIGAAALLAIGAIAAIPVAPIILRRTGTSGWGGLPSFSELWGWWSEPDPQAQKFAYNDYNDNYINREYDYAPNQVNQYDNSAWYSDYYDSGSSPSNTNQQYQPASGPSASSGQYNSPSGPASSGQARRQHHGSSHQEVGPSGPASSGQARRQHHGNSHQEVGPSGPASSGQGRRPHHNYQPVAHNRRNNRPYQQPAMTEDGHEYTTVEELNKLGEESLKSIYEQFSAHISNQQDYYQDNELRRRYDEEKYMERQGQVLPGETSYQQALLENTQKLSRDYLHNYGHQKSPKMLENTEPTRVSEFPYDWVITENE